MRLYASIFLSVVACSSSDDQAEHSQSDGAAGMDASAAHVDAAAGTAGTAGTAGAGGSAELGDDAGADAGADAPKFICFDPADPACTICAATTCGSAMQACSGDSSCYILEVALNCCLESAGLDPAARDECLKILSSSPSGIGVAACLKEKCAKDCSL